MSDEDSHTVVDGNSPASSSDRTWVAQRFQLNAILGRGGMGVVYKAFDHHTQLPVALKLMSPASLQKVTRESRFKRETEILSQLSHSHIARFIEMGSHGPYPYLAMEYIAGTTIDAWVQDNFPVSQDWIIDVSKQLLSGLQYIHDLGFLHRDIKASNLMMNQHGELKILDFGLARKTDIDDQATQVTATHVVIGTMPYLSPEHFISMKNVDQRSDIYAVGVLMYWMLTLEFPFGAVHDMEQIDLMERMYQSPPPPSLHREGIPAALERIVMKALKPDPAHRYQSADEMEKELSALEMKWEEKTIVQSVIRTTLELPFVKPDLLLAPAPNQGPVRDETVAEVPTAVSAMSHHSTQRTETIADAPSRQRWLVLGMVIGATLSGLAVYFFTRPPDAIERDPSLPEIAQPVAPTSSILMPPTEEIDVPPLDPPLVQPISTPETKQNKEKINRNRSSAPARPPATISPRTNPQELPELPEEL